MVACYWPAYLALVNSLLNATRAAFPAYADFDGDNDYDIYGQRLDFNLTEIGLDDFRIGSISPSSACAW